MSVGNKRLINDQLFTYNETVDNQWAPNSKWGFFVHPSILPTFRKYLKHYDVTYLWDIWDYELKIGDKLYDMKLIFLPNKSQSLVNIMLFLVEISQFTFYWDRKTTLYSAIDQFHILKEFISINKLTKCVVKEVECDGFNSEDQRIKVITFNNKVNRDDLVMKYRTFLQTAQVTNKIYHYYVTFALSWLQPAQLRHFEKPLKNKRVFQELQTFLTCMRELSYNREPHLDFFGLCSLKLAFCDDRKVTKDTRELEYEICALIERSLKRMKRKNTYIKNDEFDVGQYAAESNCAPDLNHYFDLYFYYRFQDLFKSIKIAQLKANLAIRQNTNQISINRVKLVRTIKLVEESNFLKKLKEMPNVDFRIDGANYTKMNHTLFCDIIQFQNVYNIELDTNQKWLNFDDNLYKVDAYQNQVEIGLFGENKYNFVERFINSLANVLNSHNIRLFIWPTLEDYGILQNLNIQSIGFYELKITKKMLQELHKCNFKQTSLTFLDCYIHNDVTLGELWTNLNTIFSVIVVEENTWQYIFEYIINHITESQQSEFTFLNNLVIQCRDEKNDVIAEINLNALKFCFDEYKTRLEIRDLVIGDMIDLYYLVNPNVPPPLDGKDLYEFYQ